MSFAKRTTATQKEASSSGWIVGRHSAKATFLYNAGAADKSYALITWSGKTGPAGAYAANIEWAACSQRVHTSFIYTRSSLYRHIHTRIRVGDKFAPSRLTFHIPRAATMLRCAHCCTHQNVRGSHAGFVGTAKHKDGGAHWSAPTHTHDCPYFPRAPRAREPMAQRENKTGLRRPVSLSLSNRPPWNIIH